MMPTLNRRRRARALTALLVTSAALVLGVWAALHLVGEPTTTEANSYLAAQTGTCEAAGLVSIGNTGLCSHGPDPVPPGTELTTVNAADVSGAAVSSQAVCTGTGTDGRRVQVLYVRHSGAASRLSAYLPSFRTWAAQGSQIYTDSAAQTGGQRFLRFVHDSNCVIDVDEATLTSAGMADFTTMVNELTAKGYGSSSRKYLIFLDGQDGDYCGRGTTIPDDSASTTNGNNTSKGYALVYNGCWSNTRTIAHELAHTFGAVQRSAPNATLWSHCTEEWDIMCYADGDGQPMVIRCPDPAYHGLLDCRHNDYFHTNPASTNYLYTHWNVARSGWLGTSGAPAATTAPANDAIGSATLVGSVPFTDETNTLWATSASTDPAAPGVDCWGEFSKTVWYQFTAPATAEYSFDTIGSAYDTILGVFSGSPTSPTRLACNDDRNADSHDSSVRVSLAAGTQVYVMVGAFRGEDGAQAVSGGYLRFTVKSFTTLSLSRSSGAYGASVGFTLSGFPRDTTVALTFDGSALTTNGTPVTVRTDANGAAQGTFSVPTAPKGTHRIGAAGGGISVTAPFQVTPRVRVFPSSGAAGTTLKIALTGYAPREPVRVRWVRPDGTSTTMTVKLGSGTTTSTPTVSSSGSGTYTFTAPTNAGVGTARIHADGTTTSSRASVTFAVADCPLSVASGRAGTRITASCAGFRAGETVNVYWDSTATTAISSVVVGANGAGAASFSVPPAAGGVHKAIFKGMSSGWSVTETLTVKPFLALTPATARASATVNAQLHGFKPGESICVRWYITSTSTRTLTCNLVANSIGSSPSFTFTVPSDATAGTHKIEGRGSLGSIATRNFNVTVTAAAQPTPTSVPNAAPTAVAGADQSLIDEDGDGVVEVTLDGSASVDPEGSPLSFAWTLNDGTALATGTRVVVAVPVGTHPFTLTVTDPAGASASDEVVVVVEAAPTPEATPTSNASPTANAGADQAVVDQDGDGVVEVTLDGSASLDPEGGPLTYTWTLANGTTLATSVDPQLVVAVPVGSHTFTLTVTDASGATARDEVIVVVQPASP